jgi:hypothetical protein
LLFFYLNLYRYGLVSADVETAATGVRARCAQLAEQARAAAGDAPIGGLEEAANHVFAML